MGTPEYMAPEQISEGRVDPRTDLYSLGVVLYETLSGVKPFRGDTAVQVLFQHLEAEVPALCDLRPEIPAEINDLVARCMSRDPEERHRSAELLERDLQATLGLLEPRS